MIREEKRLYLSHIERNLSQLNCISIESLDYANNYCGVVLCFLFKEKKKYRLRNTQWDSFCHLFCQYNHQTTGQLNNETEKKIVMSCFIP